MPLPVSLSTFLKMSALTAVVMTVACDDPTPKTESVKIDRDEFTHPKELVVGEDGLTRRLNEEQPFTGAVTQRDRDWNLRYFCYYQKGKLHGPELKFWEDGTLRRNFDYENGSKVRHREWFENGNPKTDAMFVDGHAIGPHKTWFEDGSPRWSGNFVGELLWDGHIIDYAPGGILMWDAIFDHGRFVSGTYPESEQEKLIANGMVKPEEALYPRKTDTDDPKEDKKEN